MPLLERAWKSIIWGQIGRLSEVLLGFIFVFIASRLLGPENYGIYVLFLSWVGAMLLFTALGFNESLGKFVPPMAANKYWEGIYSLFNSFLLFRVLAISLIFAVIYIWQDNFIPLIKHFSIWLLVLSVIRTVNDLFNHVFSALLKVKINTIVRFWAQFSSVLAIVVIFIFFKISVKTVIYSMVIGSFIGTFIYTFSFYTNKSTLTSVLEKISIKGALNVSVVKFSLSLWFIGFANFALGNQIDRIFLGFFLNEKAPIGFYAIASLIPLTTYSLLVTGWGITVLPVLSEAFHKYKEDGLSKAWNGYFKLQFLMLIPVSFFVVAYSKEIIIYVFGPAYEPSVLLLRVYLGLSIIFYYFSPGVSTFSLYTVSKQNLVLKIRLTAACINIILDIILIPVYGAIGAIIATGIAAVFCYLTEFVAMLFYVQVSYPFKTVFKITVSSALSVIIVRLFPHGNIFSLILSSVTYFILAIFFAYMFKPFSNYEYDIANRLSPKYAGILKLFIKNNTVQRGNKL